LGRQFDSHPKLYIKIRKFEGQKKKIIGWGFARGGGGGDQ